MAIKRLADMRYGNAPGRVRERGYAKERRIGPNEFRQALTVAGVDPLGKARYDRETPDQYEALIANSQTGE